MKWITKDSGSNVHVLRVQMCTGYSPYITVYKSHNVTMRKVPCG